jgi:hypothetical protein
MQSKTNVNHNSTSHHQINLGNNTQLPSVPKWYYNPNIFIYWSLINTIILDVPTHGLIGLVFSVHLKTQTSSLNEKSFRNLSLAFNILASVIGIVQQITRIYSRIAKSSNLLSSYTE